jgi:hypothetical protein
MCVRRLDCHDRGMTSTVRAFWGPRATSPDEGAELIASTLQTLAAIDRESYGRWLLKGRSRRDAERTEVSPSADGVWAQLKPNGTDLGSEVLPELGFTFAVWNGGKGDEAAEFVATFSVTSAHVRNVINVGLPDRIHHLAPNVLAAVREAWQPDESDVWRSTS